jgi:arylsulfatase A-like enzyme
MQTQNQPIKPKQGGLLLSLLVLTFFLLLAEISFSIKFSAIYFGDFKLIANHLTVPWRVVLPGILFYFFSQLLLHIAFALLIWGIARFAGRALNCSWNITEKIGVSLWVIALLSIIFANGLFYPNSKFAYVLLSMIPTRITELLFTITFLIITAMIALALFGLVLSITQQRKYIILVLSGGLASLIGFYCYPKAPGITDAGTAQKPNIIIIGLDSVRPDFLGFFGYTKVTPHIDRFLNRATVFSESLTPLARTYPSWVSLLTGVYPKLNTIRTNLADQKKLDLSEILPVLLKQEGYKTLFATDETRFSNIDQRYGFDELVTPPMGFNDFLLGSLNDFPLSNLVLNTKIGQYLFPYSYGNRAVFTTYHPDSFLKLLQPKLATPRTQPLLLITHFCLPHFPYGWAGLPVKKVKLRHYQASIARVDQQFYDYMKMLKKNKLLEHSIVILISDHGESVELPGDRITDPELFIAGESNKKSEVPHFYPPSSAHEKVNMSGGHGTDVLGLSQYHTLLAFKTFGLKPNQVKIVPGIVSLMDIKPTLLEYLNLPFGRANGNSLQNYIFGDKKYVDTRHDFFVESDFSPEAIRSVHPEERQVLFEGIDYFQIDPKSARIVVRESMYKMILSSKQYANYYGSWVLALYPQKNKIMIPILVNLKTGEWTNDLTTDFAKNSPVEHMFTALRLFFNDDIPA